MAPEPEVILVTIEVAVRSLSEAELAIWAWEHVEDGWWVTSPIVAMDRGGRALDQPAVSLRRHGREFGWMSNFDYALSGHPVSE